MFSIFIKTDSDISLSFPKRRFEKNEENQCKKITSLLLTLITLDGERKRQRANRSSDDEGKD